MKWRIIHSYSSHYDFTTCTTLTENCRHVTYINNQKVMSFNPKISSVFRLLYDSSHQPFRNCELLLVYRLMPRAISLIYTSEIKILLNLPSFILVWIFLNVKTVTMLMLFLEQARGRPTWSLRATWCPQAPRRWPQLYEKNTLSLILTVVL